jgi:Na+/melibiose symporter-like transporter
VTPRRSGELDAIGAITSTAGMTSLVYAIVRSAESGWGDRLTWGCFVAALVLIAGFLVHESRAAQPVMPLRLFASRERSGAYAARFPFLGAMVGFWFFTTQYLQRVLGYSAIEAGLAFLPTTIPNFVAAMAVPRLTQRWGSARLLAGGLLVSVIGMAWLSLAGPDTGYLTGVALPMALIGIGQGGSLGPLTSSGIAGVSAADAGAAGGVVNVAHQIGGSLGLAVLVTVFAAAAHPGDLSPAGLAHQISMALQAATGLLLAALVVVLFFIVRPAMRVRLEAAPPRS